MLLAQDEGLRSAADARLEQQRLDALTKRFMEQEVRVCRHVNTHGQHAWSTRVDPSTCTTFQERARQWRIAKGEATAEDLRGPAGPATRDTWMTDLPIARSGAAQPPKARCACDGRHATAHMCPCSRHQTLKHVNTLTQCMAQGNVTRFSLKARPEQGDASGWTALPGQQGPLTLQAAVRCM